MPSRLPAPRGRARVPDELRALVLVRRAAVLVILAGVVGLVVIGSGRAPRPVLLPATATVAARGFAGFGEVGFVVDAPAGPPAERAGCAVLASSAATRAAGVMGRDGFGAYAGMVFTFPAPSDADFYMAHVPVPVTLAWFDAAGSYLGQVDMIPCPGAAHCTYYGAPSAYSTAIEVPLGAAAGLGLGPGSSIHLIGPCIA